MITIHHFHRLVFNVKRLIAKAPGGSNKIASYAQRCIFSEKNIILLKMICTRVSSAWVLILQI
jgi:hypothetical protein